MDLALTLMEEDTMEQIVYMEIHMEQLTAHHHMVAEVEDLLIATSKLHLLLTTVLITVQEEVAAKELQVQIHQVEDISMLLQE